jgi:hypothetical protein
MPPTLCDLCGFLVNWKDLECNELNLMVFLFVCLQRNFWDMSLLFDQERRLPPDPARLPQDSARLPPDPARLPQDQARLQHDPARLPHNPARLPADSVRLPIDIPGSSHPGSSTPSFKVLQDARPPPAAIADFRPLAAVAASSGWSPVAPSHCTLTSQGSGAESMRSSALYMLEGGGAQLIDSRPLVPEPVVRPAAASRNEAGRPLPFMDDSQVVLSARYYPHSV